MTSAARLGRELLDGTREKIRPLSVRQASHPLTSAASPGQRTERGSHARAVPDRLDSGFRPANPPTPPRSLGTHSALRAGRPLLTRPAGRSAIAPGSGHAASADRCHSYPQGQHTPWTQVPGPATVVIPAQKTR